MQDRQGELEWQKRAIDRANAGDEASAWIVVRAILVELDVRYSEVSTLKGMTDFAEALLDLKDASGHRSPARDQLGVVLGPLRITRARGERKVAESAWNELGVALDVLQTDEAPVLRKAAAFIERLLAIKGIAPNAAPTRDDLVDAFAVLNVLPNPHRAATSDYELLGRLAAEDLEVRFNDRSVAQARARLQTGKYGLGELRQRDIRTKRPDLVDLIDDVGREELEGFIENLEPKK
ncbi:hypothetical protein LVB87_15225 [Lysobacter sp. KIS68-7]|uniref:hypothetical protein n=1 Tax=Lysobacter sp. KIS68-7 TaxID=2904252 RepID=UPI001E3C48F6|nr:hypothetical protein [Lysobacter sp. KIS68-7]UHQ19518.1 hypothetical protein LVB87_15225 [Lysobacter sp. KIS68-7]